MGDSNKHKWMSLCLFSSFFFSEKGKGELLGGKNDTVNYQIQKHPGELLEEYGSVIA